MEAFFSWVAAHHAVYGLGSTRAALDQAWYHTRARLQAHPVNGQIGADDFDDTFLQGGYSNALWPGLAAALSAYLRSGSPARSSASTSRRACRARTSSRSTTRWNAAT